MSQPEQKDISMEERCREVLRGWGWTQEQIDAWDADVDTLLDLLAG